jgi:glyoxylase-like metal-dependent hydrolase (beta-lactamase superfamily II)
MGGYGFQMLKQVTKNIYLVEGKSSGRFPFCHSVLIRDRITALIETGCGRGILKEIEKGFSPDMVIFSHIHPDHCAGSSVFPPERLWGPVESKETTGDMRRMAERLIKNDIRGDWISYMTRVPELEDFNVGNHFANKHVFDFGDTVMEAVHAPGHTDDHYCFYFPNEKVMLTTDIDFTSFGPWYGNPESDIDSFIDSINRVKGYDMKIVISSHIGVIKNGIGQGFDGFLNAFKKRDEQILAFLDSPRSIEDFVEKALIYKKYPYAASILRFFEAQMTEKHLNRLISKGLVREEGDRFVHID